MSTVRKTLDLSKYGLPEPIVFDVPEKAMGEDGQQYSSDYYPRNKQEIQQYSTFLMEAANTQLGTDYGDMPPALINYMIQFTPTEAVLAAKKLQEAKALAKQQQADPIGFDSAVGAYKAKKGDLKFNDSLSTLLPGGDPYTLSDFGDDIGLGFRSLLPEDPRQLTRNTAIVALDSYLVSKILEAQKGGKQRGKFGMLNKFYQFLGKVGEGRWGNAKTMATVGATAGPASYAADGAYTMLNQLYAYTQGIEADSISEMQRGALRDAELEILIGMGAAGLGPIARGIKKYAIDYPSGFTGQGSKEAIEKASRQGIDLPRIAASEAGWIKGYSKVIGVFPGAGGPIRQTQATARVQINDRIQQIMGTLAPGMTALRGFQFAGKEAFDAFAKNVSKFRATNAILYNSFFKQAEKIDEAFIPTGTLKKWTNSLENTLKGGDIPLGTQVNNNWIQDTGQLFELLKVGDPTASMKLLTALGSLPEHITLKQFRQLQAQLNGAIRGFGGRGGDGAMGTAGIDPQGTLAYLKDNLEHGLNDYKNWKKLSGPNEVIAQSSIRALEDANKFYMNNIDIFGFGAGQRSIGKASQEVNKNIFAPGAPFKPGSLQPDQIFNKVMTNEIALSPMAIKELREQLGKENFGKMVGTYLNKIIGQNTEIVETPFKRVKGVTPAMGVDTKIPGSATTNVPDVTGATHTSEFVPIINVDRLKSQLGMGAADATVQDRTNREAIVAMFEAMGQNGEQAFKNLEETLDIASLVNTFDISDVSDFVKRRGVLGGVKSLANAFVIGGVVSSPLATAGLILTTNRFSKLIANPARLNDVKKVMQDRVPKALSRKALINTIRGTDSYFTIFDDEGAITELEGVTLEGGVPMVQRQPGASAMNDDLRTANYFNNLIKKANAGEINGGLEDLTDIELLDYVILSTSNAPTMGTSTMTRPVLDRQGDVLDYRTVDAAGFNYNDSSNVMSNQGMMNNINSPSVSSVFGFDDPAIEQMVEDRAKAPGQNPFLVDVERVTGPRVRGPQDLDRFASQTTVGNRSLNRGQREALLDDDLDRAILEGRN